MFQIGKDLNGKNLGKGITQRKDGMYYGRAMVNGIAVSATSMSLARCKEELKTKKNELIAGMVLGVDVRKSRTITVDEWFYEWFNMYKKPCVKESSVTPLLTKYRTTFSKQIGDKKIKDLINMDIQRALNTMNENGQSASSIKEGLWLLRESLEVAKNNNILTGNPAIGIRVPWKSKKRLYRVPTVSEQRTFLEYCENNWYKEMFYVLFGTGLRIGELGGLKWSDVDWTRKTLTVQRSLMAQYDGGEKKLKLTSPKTINSYREIPFFPHVEESLKAQKEKQDKRIADVGKRRWRQEGDLSDFVFTTTFGSPVTRYIAQKEINKLVTIINDAEAMKAKEEQREPNEFASLYPHAIRHTFCTRLFEAKVEPKVIQRLMGHSQLSTTMDIYTHVTDEKLLENLQMTNDIVRV